MKKVKQSIFVTLLFFTFLIVFREVVPAQFLVPQDPFDSYSHRISWKEETYLLDNFAIFLTKNPETKGYIAYYSGTTESPKGAKTRVERAVRYLTKFRQIDSRRIIVVYGGKLDTARTVLQPVEKKAAPPDFQVPKTDNVLRSSL